MSEETQDIVADCRLWLAEDSRHHSEWARKVDRWYKAYRGEYEDARQKAAWQSDFKGRYILQIVETLCSGLSDPSPRWRVKPRPKADEATEIDRLRQGAEQLERLLSYQRDIDGMILKQRKHRLQGLIAGLSVWKTYWRYEEDIEKRSREILDPFGYPMGEEEYEERIPRVDDPCVDVVDVRDFIWPESATSIENAQRLHHRTYMTKDKLRELAKAGYYDSEKVESLPDPEGTASEDESARESELWGAERSKGRIEIIEHWIEGGKRVVTIANRNVLLKDRKNPFKHGKYPFIACAPIPELFRIPGLSIVEMVEDLQRMIWDLQRQRHDNLALLNNVIVLEPENSLVTDNVFAPGERWLIEAKDNAPSVLEMPVFPAQVTLEAEQLIKSDIQSIPGASPALLGQTDGQEQTATEISLTANLAQRRLASQKQQFTVADVRVAEQWIELNCQFLDQRRWVAVVGKDGDEGWQLVDPEDFRNGQFSIQIEQMDESLVRQERLAEATSRYQVALQGAPVMAAIGMPMNLKAYVDDILQASGIQDTARYWSSAPQPGATQQGQGGPPQPGQAPGMEAGGVTAPQAFDMNSPSNPVSQSPMAMMSRLLSQQGGPSNA